THMLEAIHAATDASIALEAAEQKLATARARLPLDGEETPEPKEGEDPLPTQDEIAALEKQVEAAKASEEAAKKAVDERRRAFDFQAAVRDLAGDRKGLRIIEIEGLKDAEGL